MKKTLQFKLVQEKGNQRFYSLSMDITETVNYIVDAPDSIRYVCVSDSVMHPETLLFWAIKNKEGEFEIHHYYEIDGEWYVENTDEYFLSRLAEVNGYNCKIIK